MGLGALRERVNGVARTTFAPVPLTFWESAFPKDVIALCYHMVSDEQLPHFALYPYKNSAQFEADVVFARERAVTYREVADSRLRGAPLPPNSLLFTFDDGMAQCYSVVRPILKRHGVDGVFFVTTGYLDDSEAFVECTVSRCLSAAAEASLERVAAALGWLRANTQANANGAVRARRALKRLDSVRLACAEPVRRELFLAILAIDDDDRSRLDGLARQLAADCDQLQRNFLSRDEVRQLADDGFTIGAHGLTHRSLEGDGSAAIEREIVASCEAVRELTGQTRVPFAFPYSGLAVERAALATILRRNPLVDLIFDSGCLRRDPHFIVNRVFTDAPPSDGQTNLPAALRDAWSSPSAWFRGPRT